MFRFFSIKIGGNVMRTGKTRGVKMNRIKIKDTKFILQYNKKSVATITKLLGIIKIKIRVIIFIKILSLYRVIIIRSNF